MAVLGALCLLLVSTSALGLGLGVAVPDVKWKPLSRADVLTATNFLEEVDHWRSMGNPLFLKFESDVGMPELVSVRNAVPMTHLVDNVDQFVKFHLFNKMDETDMLGKEIIMDDMMPETQLRMKMMEMGFDPSLHTKVIIHDFGKNFRSKDMMMIKNAYLKKGNFNMIMVDWSQLSKIPDYFMARVHVAPVGLRVSKMLDMVTKVSSEMTARKTHVIGMGLGAHIAGIASKTMEHGPVFRISALDPAMPLFARTSRFGRLHSTDAMSVDVIHTNAGGLGMMEPVGTVDFYPNGGKFQPGCGWDVFGACAHAKSAMYFVEAIDDLSKFKGVLCRGVDEALREECNAHTFTIMKEGDEIKTHGIVYVKTNEKMSFSQ